MKKLALLLSVLSLTSSAQVNKSENQYSAGFGIGSIYSGLGANFSLVSKNDMKYISAGCVEYSSFNGATCGFGAGWIKTDFFDFDSNKHGFGIYASLVGRERYASFKNNQYTHNNNEVYGVGVNYSYFMNGINHAGTTFGISIHATNAEIGSRYGGFLQAGYQF